jgi:mannose-6-phosphate isomerase-like protein (cupin superfamily)
MADTNDYGPQPFVVDIEQATLENDKFRVAKWTGANLQLTLMTIQPGDDIGLEVHTDHDQFLRIEQGTAQVEMGPSESNLNYVQQAGPDFAVFVPAGTWHNLINTGNEPLKLYSIYAPSEHPHGTIHDTKTQADAAEH